MKVYFLRHGQADWPEWDRPDSERPLTKKGKKEMRKVAAAFEAIDVTPTVVLSSPFIRAAETAEIAAEAVGLKVTEEPALAPGFDATKLAELLKKQAGEDPMLVGHEPDLSHAIAALTGGRVLFPKAGLALVEIDDSKVPQGDLIWLIPPKVLKHM